MEENEKKIFEPASDMPEQEHEEPDYDETTDEEELKGARRNMRMGLLWCVGGLAGSFLSYYSARAGGRYVIATGAIVWGAIQALNGLTAYIQLMRARGENAACKKAIVTAVCTALAIVGLGYQSWRMVQTEDMPLMENPQPYDCPELGIRFTIPAGFTAITTEHNEETDSTYAVYRISAWNADHGILVEGTAGNLTDETIVAADEIAGYLNAQAEAFFDAGLLHKGETIEINGIRLLKHAGRRTEYPNWTTAMYDMVHKGSLLTIYFNTESKGTLEKEAEAFLQTLETY